MKLVMGSCRIAEPMKDTEGFLLYPGGHVHSSREFVQAMGIMTGTLTPPAEITSHLYRGWGIRDDKRVDLSVVDGVIVELCSLKDYVYGEWILHIGYEDNLATGELTPLAGVELHRESLTEIQHNLSRLASLLDGVPITVVLHNNVPALPERYLLGYAASEWCRRTGNRIIDATSVIAEHGIEQCLPIRDGTWDYQHFTDRMKSHVRALLQSEIPSRTYRPQVSDAALRSAARSDRRTRRQQWARKAPPLIRENAVRALKRIPGLVAFIRWLRASGA